MQCWQWLRRLLSTVALDCVLKEEWPTFLRKKEKRPPAENMREGVIGKGGTLPCFGQKRVQRTSQHVFFPDVWRTFVGHDPVGFLSPSTSFSSLPLGQAVSQKIDFMEHPIFSKFCSSWLQYVGKYFSSGIFILIVKFNWVNYIFRITSLALIDVENVSFTLLNVFAELKMSNQEKCLQVAKSDFDYFRILKRDFTNLQVVIKKVWIAKISHYTIWWITFIDE